MSTEDREENVKVDENLNNNTEVNEMENSENVNANTEDDILTHFNNLFPDQKRSNLGENLDECIAPIPAPDSQEYFSPTEEGFDNPCPSVQTSTCNQSNLRTLVSVSVQSEPVLQISREVQFERPLLVEKSIQCLIVPQSKEKGSKSTCTSPMTKNYLCDLCRRGDGCDLISTTGMQHSAEGNGCSCQSVNVLSLQKVDITNLVSSSQTSPHSCSSSSCHSPKSCEMEVSNETSVGFCSTSTHTEHEKSNGSSKNGFQDHCSRTSNVFAEKKIKSSDCKNPECQVNSEESDCQSSPPRESCDKGSADTFSSQELINEMGSPIRFSQMTEKNKNNCLSDNGKSSGVQKKPVQKSRKSLSEKQAPQRIPATSTPREAEKTDVFIFSSMACERASSPESLDDDTCEVLMHTATRRIVFPITTDTSTLKDKSHPEKKSCGRESTPSSTTKMNAPLGYSRKSNEDVSIQRKNVPHNMGNSNEAITSRKPLSCLHTLVPYSSSESNHDSESPRQSDFIESSNSSTSRKRKRSRQQRDEILRKSGRLMAKSASAATCASDSKKSNTFLELLDSDSDSEAEIATVSFRTSDTRQNTSGRNTYNKRGKEATRESNPKEPHTTEESLDSDSETETVTVSCKTSNTRQNSSSRSSYNKREKEATRESNPKELHTIVESLESDSDSEAETVTVSCRTSDTRRSISRRMNYSKKEKEIILCYLIDHKYVRRVKGRKIWQDMEEADVCPGRTWQSLKEHFIKQILPRIESFGLNSAIEQKFIRMRKKY